MTSNTIKHLFVLSLLCISCQLFAQEVMSEIKFTQYVQEQVANADKKLKILVFDDLILGSKFNNASFIHSLKEEYADYKLKPEILNSIVKEVNSRIDSIYAPDPNYRIDTTKIVPVLKPKKFLDTIVTNDEGKLLYDEFNKELVIVYVEDKEEGYEGYRYFSIKELERTVYSKEKLKSLAISNLKAMLSDLSGYILDNENYRYYRSVGMDGGSKYLSSLLLLPDFLMQEKKRLQQHVVVAIPKENQIIVISKKNKLGIREIKTYAAKNYFLKEDELLTTKMYQWDGTVLKRF